MGSEKREKASDIFEKAESIFQKKMSFSEAFPQIDNISIEIKEYENGIRSDKEKDFWNKISNSISYPHINKYSISYTPGEYIDCSNSLCYNGGFSIGEIIRSMIRRNEEVREDSILCQGYEGSPKGRRKYGDCPHEFDYKIIIKYKEN